MNTLFPIYVKMDQIRTLLVGAGPVGLEKLEAIFRNSPHAHVHIVAERVESAVKEFVAGKETVSLSHRIFRDTDLENVGLVILATDNAVLNDHIRQLTMAQNILLNVADKPGLCDFYLGSVVQKGNLKIGISTNGKSPTIAKRVKEFLQEIVPDEIDETLTLMQEMRDQLKGDLQGENQGIEYTYTGIGSYRQDMITGLKKGLETLDAREIVQYISDIYGDKSVFSTSFGIEDQVITHLLADVQAKTSIFTLETGRLFPETYYVWNRTLEKYKLPIKAYYPNTTAVERMVTEKGPSSFYESIENRKECCYVRKIEPLKRAIQGFEVWVTGIRAEQSSNREDMDFVEWDETNRIIKVHPLFNWTLVEVEDFLKQNNVPYNPLHHKGFPSIGCQPCTRAIQPGEDFRSGRWWWEDKSKKECGLHATK